MGGLAGSLRTQSTVIYALFIRDMNSRYANSRLGYLMAFMDPVFGIAIVAGVRYYVRGLQTRHGMPMVLFVVTGYLVWYAFKHTSNEIRGVTEQKSSKAMMMFPQVTLLDVILSRGILAWFTYMGVLAMLSMGIIFFTHSPPPKDNGLVIYVIFVALWLGGSIGVLMGLSLRFIPSLSWIYMALFRAGPFVCGAIFTADELPAWLHPYLAWNPVFHLCDLARVAWAPSYISPIATVQFPFLCALCSSVFALLAERAVRAFKTE